MTTNQEEYSHAPLGWLSRPGLHLLLQAYEYALDLDRDVWDFAVELPTLQKAGLSSSDLRWLAYKGYANHARETTASDDSARSFQRQNHLALWKRSCFVVTESGATYIRDSLLRQPLEGDEPSQPDPSNVVGTSDEVIPAHNVDEVSAGTSESPAPTWDCDRQELRVGRMVVKEFKLHSPNQVMILAAFEEQGWPPRMDDPLPPQSEINRKERLHDTIEKLNRKQKCRLVRFRGDLSGQAIQWEFQAGGS